MENWKNKVVTYLKLKTNGIIFPPSIYDFIYVYNKKSIGIITELHGKEILSISFFKSLNSSENFSDVIKINRQQDVIIPRYESLIKLGHAFIKKISSSFGSHHHAIGDSKSSQKNNSKFNLYGRLHILFKENGDQDDYFSLLNLVVKLIDENNNRHQSRD